MSNYIGTKEITKIYLGSTEIKKLYVGEEPIWDGGDEGGIDINTLLCLHFDDNLNDASLNQIDGLLYLTNDYGPVQRTVTYTTGKFDKALYEIDWQEGETHARYYDSIFKTKLESSQEATIDFWILKDPNNYGFSSQTKISINSNSTKMSMFCYSSSVFAIGDPVFGGSLDNGDIDISSITENTYFHIAMVYKNSVLKIYLNGNLVKTGTYNTSSLTSQDYISIQPGTNAVIDELRVSSIARWTTNFTPPTQPYGN